MGPLAWESPYAAGAALEKKKKTKKKKKKEFHVKSPEGTCYSVGAQSVASLPPPPPFLIFFVPQEDLLGSILCSGISDQ